MGGTEQDKCNNHRTEGSRQPNFDLSWPSSSSLVFFQCLVGWDGWSGERLPTLVVCGGFAVSLITFIAHLSRPQQSGSVTTQVEKDQVIKKSPWSMWSTPAGLCPPCRGAACTGPSRWPPPPPRTSNYSVRPAGPARAFCQIIVGLQTSLP